MRVQELVNRSLVTLGDVQFYKDSLKLVIAGRKKLYDTPGSRAAELSVLQRESYPEKGGDPDPVMGRERLFPWQEPRCLCLRLRKHLNASNCISIDNVYGVGFVFNTHPPNKAPIRRSGASVYCVTQNIFST